MGLTQVSTSGIKDATVATADIADNAVTSDKIGSEQVIASNIAGGTITTGKLANDLITTAKIADEAVTLAKLPHGTSSNNGKFLRANNGADPSFETVTSTTINSNADNRVITGTSTANTLNAESALTFDGTKLGINETSPLGLVHIDSDDTTAPLYIDCATNNKALTVRNPNGGDGSLTIHGASNECDWAFNTFNTGNALYIKNDGRVGIRKTPSSTLDIETASNANGFNLNCIGTPANYFFNVRDDNVSKFFIGNNGSIGVGTDNPFGPTGYGTIELNGATGGCITFSDDDTQKFEMYGSDAHLGIYNRTNTKYIAYFKKGGDVELADGNLKLASGHGIDFSATGNGNGTMSNELLDDYEEGTWVPTMTFNGNSTGVVYNQQDGRYTKIGNEVYASFVIGITDKGSSTGNWQIGGLPYVSKNDSGDRINGFITYYGGMISVNTHISLYNSMNTSNFYGYNGDANSTSAQNLTHSNVNDSAHLRGHVIYRTT